MTKNTIAHYANHVELLGDGNLTNEVKSISNESTMNQRNYR